MLLAILCSKNILISIYLQKLLQCGEYGHLSASCRRNAHRGVRSWLVDVVEEDSIVVPSFITRVTGEFETETTHLSVAERMEKSANFWETYLEAPEFVLSIIKEGYRLPFGQHPSTCFLANNKSLLDHTICAGSNFRDIIKRLYCRAQYAAFLC